MMKPLKSLLTFLRWLKSAPWVMDNIWDTTPPLGHIKSAAASAECARITALRLQALDKMPGGATTVVSMSEWLQARSRLASGKSQVPRRLNDFT